jgi:hypothetical protein
MAAKAQACVRSKWGLSRFSTSKMGMSAGAALVISFLNVLLFCFDRFGWRPQMRKLAGLAALLIALVASGAPATTAEQCPVGEAAINEAGSYVRAVEAAVRAAPNSQRAYETHAACQLNSSGDNALAEIVRSKCERLFMGKASPAAKKAYRSALTRCDTIAQKNEGTMYQGPAAVCRAKAARDYARRYAGRR